MDMLRESSHTVRCLAMALQQEDLVLLDVGCSGGIHPVWRQWGDRLRAFAFDPSIHAIQSLRAMETNPKIDYISGFVGLPPGHPAKDRDPEFWRVDPWSRLAAFHTQERQKTKIAEAGEATTNEALPESGPTAPPSEGRAQQDLMDRNLWREAALAPEAPIILPEFLAARGISNVDFVKIDVDGKDLEILHSLFPALDDAGILGAVLEVNFHGASHPHANSFHNMDRLMREAGFDLMDLTIRKYSVDTLPFPFLYPYPLCAQSAGGRPFQGDALYLRDVCFPHRQTNVREWSIDKLLKLAGLYTQFGLVDHAAELLITHRHRLERSLDIDAALDLLTDEVQSMPANLEPQPRYACYGDYIRSYHAEEEYFYGVNTRREQAQAQQAQAAERMAEQLKLAKSEIDRLHSKLLLAEKNLVAFEASTMWRATALARRLLEFLRGLGRKAR